MGQVLFNQTSLAETGRMRKEAATVIQRYSLQDCSLVLRVLETYCYPEEDSASFAAVNAEKNGEPKVSAR